MKRWAILFAVAVVALTACDLDTEGGFGRGLGGNDRAQSRSDRLEARLERRLDRQRDRRRAARLSRLKAQREAAREARQEQRREERQARREEAQQEEEEQAVAAAEEPSCTEGYDPCLVPAADYDCAGGTGDGPAYTGYVTVSGSDPYDLDADGDGAGCES